MRMTLDRMLDTIPSTYPGPGGAVAVLRGGEVIARHAWGFANAERRIPFTPSTLFRICSITKQFTSAAMLAAFPDPSVLDADVAAMLPLLEGRAPGALHLAHNQSGLRDYWAVAMLHGSPVEAAFGDAEAARVIGGTRSLHFAPGQRYSYVNQNFRIISDILQARAGRDFATILRERVLGPAGMHSAILAADTRALPDGTEGYEGNPTTGFRAAENRILWTGDAGMAASLNDMIAWERHIDATRDDPASLYQRLCAAVTFGDGQAAPYGFGLARGTEFGRAITGHGGALRGWRSHRLHMAAERLSVVVLFNHFGDAAAAALDLLAAALGETRSKPAERAPLPGWLGAYTEPQTGLAVRLDGTADGRVRLRFGHGQEILEPAQDGAAGNGRTRVHADGAALIMHRPQENFSTQLTPITHGASPGIAGRYHCAELDAWLTVTDGVPYGGFSGFLGLGRMELLEPIAADLWALPCPRALDHTPPGDWTLAFQRDGAGAVTGVLVGCWLARGLRYERR